MPVLTQGRFPKLWAVFQKIVGGTRDKRRLAIKEYRGQRSVLEIGCSIGNVSAVFLQFPNVAFTGIDIDEAALQIARDAFSHARNFRFENLSTSDLVSRGDTFDYVLFANILHHVDDSMAESLLRDAKSLLADGGTLIVMEPEKDRSDYGLVYRVFYLLERGLFRRSKLELINLVRNVGLNISSVSDEHVAPDSIPLLRVGCITFISATRQQ